MTSLWLDRALPLDTDPFEPDARYDVVVAGAGITGLVTALLFARSGLRVAVLEARRVGAAATGNTTAKLSLLQGSHLSDILRHSTKKFAAAYVEGNREGAAWLLRYCAEHEVPVERRDAVSYAATADGLPRLEEEYRASRLLGLDTSYQKTFDVPFPHHGGVRLADQAQFDPMDVLAALCRDLRSRGGVVIEGTRVLRARTSAPVRITTNRGEVTADRLVLATGMPFMDRGLYFAKVEALRSYAIALRTPAPLPREMFLSVDSPTRSVRTAPDADGELLLVGGNGHPVGREPSPAARSAELEEWAKRYFPGAVATHHWSAQDYQSAGRIPFVGWLPRSRGRVFVATGFDKWGMSNAVAAALTLSADVLGGHLPWARTLHRRITTPADVASFLGANAAVGVAAVRGYAGAWRRPEPEIPPAEGSGVVGHRGARPVAVSTVAGQSCTLSAVCPHLYGVVSWNDAELSWDCPLHGSRFSANGEPLEGPAVTGLRRLEPSA
jgi:glycine/D-amino acid oxidase-like deaminating enzyme/nitrite reductase/ring-hydroxylating ferredoxin subunit